MDKIEKTCPVCKTNYLADPKRLKFNRQTTCSRKCSYVQRANKHTTCEQMTCPVCGELFFVHKCRLKRVKRTAVCSKKCVYDGIKLGIIKRDLPKTHNLSPEARKKFSERAILMGRSRKLPDVYKQCESCKKDFKVSRDESKKKQNARRFCSNKCANIGLRGKGNPSWRGGHPKYYGESWRPLRRQARERDNNTCQRCGHASMHKLPVHHILPVSLFENPEHANIIENLVCLCSKCHGLVEWNGIDFNIKHLPSEISKDDRNKYLYEIIKQVKSITGILIITKAKKPGIYNEK